MLCDPAVASVKIVKPATINARSARYKILQETKRAVSCVLSVLFAFGTLVAARRAPISSMCFHEIPSVAWDPVS